MFKDLFISCCRANHFRLQTERAYWHQARKFILWTGAKSADELKTGATDKFRKYLTSLANINPERIQGDEGVSASYQNSAFHAVRFLYEKVLETPLGDLSNIPRATGYGRIVDVPDDETALKLVKSVGGTSGAALRLICGTAGRLNDILRLRVKDLDFRKKLVAIQESKGGKSRLVPMPESLIPELASIVRAREITHKQDLEAGHGWVAMPGLLAKKYPKEPHSLGWQYVFAASDISRDPITGNMGRWHLHPVTLQKAFQNARARARIRRHYTIHSLRHSTAQFWERNGLTVSQIAELLGHSDIQTTHRYLKSGKRGVVKAPSPI